MSYYLIDFHDEPWFEGMPTQTYIDRLRGYSIGTLSTTWVFDTTAMQAELNKIVTTLMTIEQHAKPRKSQPPEKWYRRFDKRRLALK